MKRFLQVILVLGVSVLLFTPSSSCVSKKKFRASVALRDSLRTQLNDCESEVRALKRDIKKKDEKVEVLNRMVEENEALINKLKETLSTELSDYDKKDVGVDLKDGKAFITFSDKLLFAAGSSEIDPKGKEVLQIIARVLIRNPLLTVFVEGHTDDVPIKTARYRDNWDLSVDRASNVVRTLIAFNVEPERIIASGRGEFKPTVSNEDASNRVGNRRIELIIEPRLRDMYNLLKNQ